MASTVGLLLGGFFMKTRFTSFLFASLLAFSSAVQVSPVQADVNNKNPFLHSVGRFQIRVAYSCGFLE